MNPITGLFFRDVLPFAARFLPMELVYYACEFYARLKFFLGNYSHFVKNTSRYIRGLSTDEARRLTRELLVNWYKTFLDFAVCGGFPKRRFERMVSSIGLKNIDEALALGRGVILFSMHSGMSQ
jgi:lauroyl/myristoyl acyltransferase